jgi:adhesin transport system membrane fusion protein
MTLHDDTEFMSQLDQAAGTRPTLSSHLLLLSVVALVMAFVIWASFSKIEEITRGLGQVVPTSEIQIVQSLEGGILSELLVNEGDVAEKNQILLKISDVASSSEEKGTEARSWSLKAKKARLEAESSGKNFSLAPEITQNAPDIARNEEQLYRSRQQELSNAKSILDDKISRASAELSEIQAKISRLSESRVSLEKELVITQDMVKKRAVPQLEEIRLTRELNDLSGQIRESSQRRAGLEAELRSARKERADQEDKFRSQALGELNAVQTEISQLDQNLTATRDRVSRADIRAPVAGVINKISIKTIGGVIEPAMKLVEIVPVDDALKIVAKVAPHDIAFLKPGLTAKVKISAYNPQKYGSLNGKLVRIGANSVVDREGRSFFEIEVRTDQNHLGTPESPLPITPGMEAQVEIVTGKRSIMEYLLKPILRVRDRALTER